MTLSEQDIGDLDQGLTTIFTTNPCLGQVAENTKQDSVTNINLPSS